MFSVIFLCIGGFLAAFVDSIAGGGGTYKHACSYGNWSASTSCHWYK
ncbi:membrane protein [Clostridioides difficile]|uniref:Membrane protein n=1 Tax=Clostridioides difficile TaxID=1496 RepID=A0AB74R0A3_CLODI|nr:hypothetical protein [Clostridioides difficile]AXB61139.1 hypothetical protein CDIF27638_02089 [Clostridioides difficile]AXB68585.1 hypothetical protein CDIF27640_02088 [Clostridioides difficile]AXU57441.1 hypothetical protein CDIF28196_02088 [Clostridioides difficile]EIS9855802.1 hypothetical protein [Clostridioides difficile]EJA6336653.1 hypothetical protein [Clostridioides difficile]